MKNIFMRKPISQAEAIMKLSQKMPIKMYTSQILALSALEEAATPKFSILA